MSPTGVMEETVCKYTENHDPIQTFEETHTSYLVKGTLGKPIYMEGIIMDCETGVTTGDHVLLVVPSVVSVVMSTNPVRRKYSSHIDIRRHLRP